MRNAYSHRGATYMAMYLIRLSNKLRPDDPGWDVPLAMEQSLLARISLFVSVVSLPVYAALALQIRAPFRWGENNFEIVVMLVGLIVSLTLSVLSWKYRPRLNEP